MEDGKELSLIRTWGEKHKDNNHEWINEIAKNKYVSYLTKFRLCILHYCCVGDDFSPPLFLDSQKANLPKYKSYQ